MKTREELQDRKKALLESFRLLDPTEIVLNHSLMVKGSLELGLISDQIELWDVIEGLNDVIRERGEQNNLLAIESSNLKYDMNELNKERRALNREIKRLVEANKDEFGRDVDKLNKIIGEMEKSIADQDNELEELEAVKIVLEKENKVLWQYYENEEKGDLSVEVERVRHEMNREIKMLMFERIHKLENRLKNG